MMIDRAIVIAAENPRRPSTGNDLILVVTRQRDVEASSVATGDMVCTDECCRIVCIYGLMVRMSHRCSYTVTDEKFK